MACIIVYYISAMVNPLCRRILIIEYLRKAGINTMFYSLSTLERKTLIAIINAFEIAFFSDIATLQDKIINAIDELIVKYPTVFVTAGKKAYISFSLAYSAKKAVDINTITALEYIRILAHEKRNNASELNDYGAYGDLFEILIRIALIGNINLIHSNTLHVKAINCVDIISKKYGKLEIGQNGKTWQEGTVFDFMAGSFTGVIYGVFSKQDINSVFDLCENGNIKKAIEYVASYSVLWQDKYEFLYDIDNLTAGKGITIKSKKIMSQFNPGKYNAFINAIENGKFKSLQETLTNS